MGPETHVLQKDVATSHAPPEGGALGYLAFSASPMDGTGTGQSRRAPEQKLEASRCQWQAAETEAALYRKRMLAKVGGDTSRAIAFSDDELGELITHTKALGFSQPDIEAILIVKLRKPNVACETLMEVADCLAQKRGDKRIGFKEGWDFMKAYRAGQEAMLQGNVLEPEVYLNADYIESHRKNFSGKASYLIPADLCELFVIDKKREYPHLGYLGALYVSTSSEIDRVLAEAEEDIAIIEKLLGFSVGCWQNRGGIFRVDIDSPETKGLRIPNGNEASANAFWTPGAFTSGGTMEAVLDQVPKTEGNYRVQQVVFEDSPSIN